MGMIKVLRPSSMLARCDQCRLPFDPVSGGVCSRCGQLLCGRHIFGSILRRMQSFLSGPLICVACRAKAEGPPTA